MCSICSGRSSSRLSRNHNRSLNRNYKRNHKRSRKRSLNRNRDRNRFLGSLRHLDRTSRRRPIRCRRLLRPRQP